MKDAFTLQKFDQFLPTKAFPVHQRHQRKTDVLCYGHQTFTLFIEIKKEEKGIYNAFSELSEESCGNENKCGIFFFKQTFKSKLFLVVVIQLPC